MAAEIDVSDRREPAQLLGEMGTIVENARCRDDAGLGGIDDAPAEEGHITIIVRVHDEADALAATPVRCFEGASKILPPHGKHLMVGDGSRGGTGPNIETNRGPPRLFPIPFSRNSH